MESRGEERSGEPRALRMSGDPGRESLAGAQRGAVEEEEEEEVA